MEDNDKRDAERVLILGELRGDMKVPQSMHVRDLSTDGITVETLFPLQPDSLLEVRLTLGDTPVVVKGRVIHSYVIDVGQDSIAYRTGLELVDPSPSVSLAIEEFLDAVKADRGGE